jgi:ankyrin repeat protein
MSRESTVRFAGHGSYEGRNIAGTAWCRGRCPRSQRLDIFARCIAKWTSQCRTIPGLLENNADVNAQGPDGSTPLHLASDKGQLEIARLVLQYGATVDCQDREDRTPLHNASLSGHLDVVRLLLHSGAALEGRNSLQNTPLASASSEGDVNVSRFLIEQGACRREFSI